MRYEDETGKPEELVDKNIANQPYYKRNTTGTIHIDIQKSRQWTNIRIIGFIPDMTQMPQTAIGQAVTAQA